MLYLFSCFQPVAPGFEAGYTLTMKQFVRILAVCCLLAASAAVSIPSCGLFAAKPGSTVITLLELKGAITPVQAEYLERGFKAAENANAGLIVIQMDTPGGLDDAMRDIIQLVQNSPVPVAVYVIPGGRAASAGFYITISADIAAMAPNASIGAATPVALGQDGETELSDEMQAKLLNDSIAYARSLAEARGRNAEWAELAVREAASVSAGQALELDVIDIVAPTIDSLLASLNGIEVTRPDGSTTTIDTSQVEMHPVDMSFMEGLLLALSDPNIAYILLSLAILGITVEIFNPGLIFPGVAGGICGLMAFYSLGVLPVNYAGILLMVLAVALFIAEALTPAFGILTAGGLVSFAAGSLILFKGGPLFSVNPWLIAIILILAASFLMFVIQKVVAAHRSRAATGSEDLAGRRVPVRTELAPGGTVFYEGEIWKAVLDEGRAEPGENVVITGSEGLTLHVTKINKGGN